MTKSSSKIAKVPAYKYLANAVMEQILDGRMKEGDPLPTETVLGEIFGVSRATVREGIRVLEEANMIRRESNSKKMYISRPSHQETGAQLARALIMHDVTFAELWEAILVTEPILARMAARKCDGALLAQIELNLEKTALAIKKGSPIFTLDREFHNLISRMSSNMVFDFARDPINHIFRPSYMKVMGHKSLPTQQLLESHKAIVKAIRSKNADEAEQLMRKHVQDFSDWAELTGIIINDRSPTLFSGKHSGKKRQIRQSKAV